MTHPDPAIRAQYEKDRDAERVARGEPPKGAMVGNGRRGWQETVRDWQLARWVVGFLFGMLSTVAYSSFHWGEQWGQNGAYSRLDSLNNVAQHAQLIQTDDAMRHSISYNTTSIQSLRATIDTMKSRQAVMLLILCDQAGTAEIRRLCRLGGFQNGTH